MTTWLKWVFDKTGNRERPACHWTAASVQRTFRRRKSRAQRALGATEDWPIAFAVVVTQRDKRKPKQTHCDNDRQHNSKRPELLVGSLQLGVPRFPSSLLREFFAHSIHLLSKYEKLRGSPRTKPVEQKSVVSYPLDSQP
jgi:hypothetical protein